MGSPVVGGDDGRVGTTAGDINTPSSCRKIMHTGGLGSTDSVRWGGPIRVDAPSPSDPGSIAGFFRGGASLFPLESAGPFGGGASVSSFSKGDRACLLRFAGDNGSSVVPDRSHGSAAISPVCGEGAGCGGTRGAPLLTKKQ